MSRFTTSALRTPNDNGDVVGVPRLARLRLDRPLPRDQLVREPGLGRAEVAFEEALHRGSELLDEVVSASP